MATKTVRFLVPADKIERIDALAEVRHLEREKLLNEALDQYLDTQDYHRDLIEQGLREAEEGNLIPFDTVKHLVQAQRQNRKPNSARLRLNLLKRPNSTF